MTARASFLTETIPNIGIAGFIMKKTIQSHSLRQLSPNTAADFKDTNMLMYINKKLASVRQRLGTNQLPLDFLSNPCLRIKPPKKGYKEFQKDVFDGLNKERKLNKEKEINYLQMANSKNRSKSVDNNINTMNDNMKNIKPFIKKTVLPAGRKVSQLLHNSLKEEELLAIYYQFKLKKREKLDYKGDISPGFLKTLQGVQEENIIKELSEKSGVDLPKMLGLERDFIKEFMIEDGATKGHEKMKMKKFETKHLSNRMSKLSDFDINRLMKKEDKRNLAQSLESFNSTRLENLSMEKNRKKKVVGNQSFYFKLKEKNEEFDDQILNQHLSDIHKRIREKSNVGIEKFIRKKTEKTSSFHCKISRSKSFFETLSRPRSQRENKLKMADFISDCNEKIIEQREETKSLEKGIKEIGSLLSGMTEEIKKKDSQLFQEKKFMEFLDQREFKKKFLNHFIEKIIDPQGILSHYRRKLPMNK